MTTRRDYAGIKVRESEEQLVHPQAPQVIGDPLAKHVTNIDYRVPFQVLFQAMMAQENREAVDPVNPNVNSVA